MSARRKEKKRRVFQTPVGQGFGDVILIVLGIPIAAAAGALLVVAGAEGAASRIGVELGGIWALGVAGAVVVLVLIFRFRGWPAWTLELDQDAALLGPFPRRRVPYEDITFIAAGTWRGWTGHHDDAEAYPLRVETRSGRVITLRLAHKDADKALRMLHERARSATALDAAGDEHLPESGDPLAIVAGRARLAAIWAPVVWLAFAAGIAAVALGVWGLVNAVADGEWGAGFGALLIGAVGAWACGTAWWKALRRMRGHRRRVEQARAALRQTGQLPEA